MAESNCDVLLLDAKCFADWFVANLVCPQQNIEKEGTIMKLSQYFTESENPFVTLLDMTTHLDGQKVCDRVWKCFFKWQQTQLEGGANKHEAAANSAENWKSTFDRFLTDEVQRRAAELALKDNLKMCSMVSSAFHFEDHESCQIVRDIFCGRAQKCCEEGDFQGLSVFFSRLGSSSLANFVSLSWVDDDILQKTVVYLICKNNSDAVKQLLSKVDEPSRIHTAILRLDSFLECSGIQLVANVRQFLGLGQNFYFPGETFEIIVSGLPRSLNLPLTDYRNSTFIDLKKKTKFLARSTFGPEAEMDVTTFRELITEFSKVDDRYKAFAIENLKKFGLSSEVEYFTQLFDLDKSGVTPSERATNASAPRTSGNSGEMFAKFQLPMSIMANGVFFVDSMGHFRDIFRYILALESNNHLQTCVGIDLEWPGVLPPNRPQLTSIMQLALVERIFIIDIENLTRQFEDGDIKLMNDFFGSKRVTKVSHGFTTDMKMLKKSLPDTFNTDGLESHVDIGLLTKQVWEAMRAAKAGPVAIANRTDYAIDAASCEKAPSSLSNIVQWVLGRQLPKMYRMSNWSRRPLEIGQLQYAAADAYCLLEVYHQLNVLISSLKLSVPPV